jgi:hypothetical protein
MLGRGTISRMTSKTLQEASGMSGTQTNQHKPALLRLLHSTAEAQAAGKE